MTQETAANLSRRPLRVVHVTWGLDVGGLEQLLVEIARHADRRNVSLHFVSLSTRGRLAAAIEAAGWPVTALGEPEGLRPGLVARLARLFRRLRVDVVHTHNTKALVYGGPAARLAGVYRLVHTWHGQNLVGSRREELLFRLLGRLPDAIVAVSHDAGRLLVRDGIPPGKVHVIHNGIDTRRFGFAGPVADGPVVAVARLSPEKDIQTLVRAMALAHRHDPSLRLEIAGDGACRADLQRLASELGLNGQARFLGSVDDIPALLRRAGMFVLPSLTEGISLTLLEASAMGLPVIATNVGGNSEIVQNGVNGLLVPARAPKELAGAIVELRQDLQRRQQLGAAARRGVEQCFDVRRMVTAYEELYREADLRRRGRSNPLTARYPPHCPRPRVVTNVPKLAEQRDLLRCTTLPKGLTSWQRAIRLWRRGLANDTVVLNQDYRTLGWLCLLRALTPLRSAPLVSLDLVLSRPGPSLRQRGKALAKRIILRQVDLFLMHMKERKALRDVFGIAPARVRYVPFKVNFLEQIAAVPLREGEYIFTGGRSRRDYQTFCAAMAGLDYPGLIVTPPPEINAEHGTSLEGVRPPANVRLLHDDGSWSSWVEKIAGARLVVFCISPETISPSGVGAYLVAMALKKCVIISDCPATRDIVVDGETAILVPMRDPEALRAAIRRAWQDDDYRKRIAEGGYRYALSLGGEQTLAHNVAAAVADFVRRRGQR